MCRAVFMITKRVYTREIQISSLVFGLALASAASAAASPGLPAPFGEKLPTPQVEQVTPHEVPKPSSDHLKGMVLTKLNIMEASGQLTPESAAKYRDRFNQLMKSKTDVQEKGKSGTANDSKLIEDLQAMNSELDGRRKAHKTTAGWFNWF